MTEVLSDPAGGDDASGSGACCGADGARRLPFGPGGNPLADLAAALDRLAALPREQLATESSLPELCTMRNRLECIVAGAASVFAASGVWCDAGARTPAMWIAVSAHLPRSEAGRLIRLGRASERLPETGRAFAEGAVGAAQVEMIDRSRNDRTAEALERDEPKLAEHARRLRFDDFVRVCRYWSQAADPDGADESDFDRLNARRLNLARDDDGVLSGSFVLDPVSGEIVANEMQRIERELFEKEWAEAKDRLGREPVVSELPRTPGQRRCDALVEMATRSASSLPGAHRPRPLVSVLVGWETLHGRLCELASGAVISPWSVVRLLEGADIERAVFSLPNRAEVSVRARFFAGATRRAVELRDRRCVHPFCDVRADRAQIDHIVQFTDGGLTIQENGRVLCGWHNSVPTRRPPPPEDDPHTGDDPSGNHPGHGGRWPDDDPPGRVPPVPWHTG